VEPPRQVADQAAFRASRPAQSSRRIAGIDARIGQIDTKLANEFPEYAALANPQPLSVAEVQALLDDDDVLIALLDTWAVDPLPEETFVWVVTKTKFRWFKVPLGVARVTVMFNPATAPYRAGSDFLRVAQAAAPLLGMEVKAAHVHDVAEFEPVIAAVAREGNGSLICLPDIFVTVHRGLTIELTARYRVPALYQYRFFTDSGGLISYGPDVFVQYARAAEYIDRILKGAKVSDLPVQAPTKYELVINLKTAGALGLDVPEQLLQRADELIE
jgi:ABC transporter substrate binding protein